MSFTFLIPSPLWFNFPVWWKIACTAESQLKSHINYTNYNRFSWEVYAIFKAFPNTGSIFLHKGKKSVKWRQPIREERWRDGIKITTDEKETAINLNFRCLRNYPVNLYGGGAFGEAVEYTVPYVSCRNRYEPWNWLDEWFKNWIVHEPCFVCDKSRWLVSSPFVSLPLSSSLFLAFLVCISVSVSSSCPGLILFFCSIYFCFCPGFMFCICLRCHGKSLNVSAWSVRLQQNELLII
jgi:hypothetical protein